MDGRTLRFHLGGVNNQNFIMFDEETGSWWQQITGECIFGPLKGKRLRRISSDEVTLAIWRADRPQSSVVKFDPKFLSEYASSDWEKHMATTPTPAGLGDGPVPPRELVVGIEIDGVAAAYPLVALRERSPVNTRIGSALILLLVSPDGNSVRSFLRPRIGGQELEFFRRAEDGALIDSGGSVWNFAGKAVSGPLAGHALDPVQNTKDFWFDWHRYNPAGALRTRGF